MDGDSQEHKVDAADADYARTLLERCQTLVEELDQLRQFLLNHKKEAWEDTLELKVFYNHINAELKCLEKVSLWRTTCCIDFPADRALLQHVATNPSSEYSAHALHSSNFPFHATVWDAAKATRGLIAINKRFFWERGLKRSEKKSGRRKKQSALVDIVAEGGKQWIKVSTVTESRLLFDLAKAGWEQDSDESTSDDTLSVLDNSSKTANGLHAHDAEDEIEIVRLAYDLQKASQATYVEYEHPKVVFVLPRLPPEGASPETSKILIRLKATGAELRCGPVRTSGGPLDDLFRQMILDDTGNLSETLNIDCTILLALVSDLSHCSASDLLGRSDASEYHPVIKRQIAGEEDESLLPKVLYPILQGRRLVCTREAAKRMQDIVNTMGTTTEAARTRIFIGTEMGDNEQGGKDPSTAATTITLEDLSIHLTPSMRLPIDIVDFSPQFNSTKLPKAAKIVSQHLSLLNKSVFLYGWAEDITTITSNRAVSAEIEHTILELKKRNGDEFTHLKGPKVWMCDTARSLVGKEKGRKFN